MAAVQRLFRAAVSGGAATAAARRRMASLAQEQTPSTAAAKGFSFAAEERMRRRPAEERNVQWVFLGCPGVGKGTYASRLSRLLGMPHIAIGDLVRDELASTGPLAAQSFIIFSRPIKFAAMFTFGNILAVGSATFVMGPQKQLRMMFDPVCLYATAIYVGCVVLALIFALWIHDKLLTLIAIICDICALFCWHCLLVNDPCCLYTDRTHVRLLVFEFRTEQT